MIKLCCVCKKILDGLSRATRYPKPGELDNSWNVSHGYCRECYAAERARFGLPPVGVADEK